MSGEHSEYRRLFELHGTAWGEELIPYVGEVATSAYLMGRDFLGACFRQLHGATRADLDARMADLDLERVVRDALDGEVLDNLPVVRLTPDGGKLEAITQVVLDAARPQTPAGRGPMFLLDSQCHDAVEVRVDGVPYVVQAGGARVVPGGGRVTVAGQQVDLGALERRAAPARIRLRAGFPCRWSVISANGQGWYPAGAPRKLDSHRRPHFHGDDLLLDVPAEAITVAVTRGMEYGAAEVSLVLSPGEQRVVELRPERLYDAAARGWYGGDLHVHLNWMGDDPAEPERAIAALHGEDLHMLNLVAGNVAGERVYDRASLERWAGRDLPGSDATHVARFGVEYRSDLLGHVTAFGLTGVPGRYHRGFAGSSDDAPNTVALTELRELGGLTGYGHPFHTDLSDDDPPDKALAAGRNCSAREIVADAALDLIDTLDVVNHSSIQATAVVYRRLLGAGNRLAVTAGSDSVLSISRRGTASSPPGWERVYAQLDGPLTAEAFAEAVRQGRTFATTGPWLELTVDGHGPGHTLLPRAGDRVEIRVRSIGPEVERLEIRTADGLLATGGPGELVAELTVREPTYVVAVAAGGPHPRSLHPAGAYAHTSPVYLGEQVVREADVVWCLRWLDLLEDLLEIHGCFDSPKQREAHVEVYRDAARIYNARLRQKSTL